MEILQLLWMDLDQSSGVQGKKKRLAPPACITAVCPPSQKIWSEAEMKKPTPISLAGALFTTPYVCHTPTSPALHMPKLWPHALLQLFCQRNSKIALEVKECFSSYTVIQLLLSHFRVVELQLGQGFSNTEKIGLLQEPARLFFFLQKKKKKKKSQERLDLRETLIKNTEIPILLFHFVSSFHIPGLNTWSEFW